jgi:hypothetical protein
MNRFTWVRILQVCLVVFNYFLLKDFFPTLWWGFAGLLAFAGSVIQTIIIAVTIGFLIGFFVTAAAGGENIPDDVQLPREDQPVILKTERQIKIINESPDKVKFGDIVFASWIELEELGKYDFDGLVNRLGDGSYDMKWVPNGGLIIEPGLLYLPQKV